jgi:ComF family protein
MSHWLLRIINASIDALFPVKCLGCGLFFRPQNVPKTRDKPDGIKYGRLLGYYLCARCTENIIPVQSPMCTCCGLMFKSRVGADHFCGDCLTSPKRFGKARAAVIYDQALMNVVHRFKYRGKIQLAKPLGALLLAAFIHYWEKDSIDLVVPVPLYAGRFRKRGFNQAFLLLRSWKKIAPVFQIDLSGIQVGKDILVRTRATASQTGLGRKQRAVNIRNAFGVREVEKIEDKRILLVDDVYTTGATAAECARVLMDGGAKWVDVLTLARAL